MSSFKGGNCQKDTPASDMLPCTALVGASGTVLIRTLGPDQGWQFPAWEFGLCFLSHCWVVSAS
jgi:hypothetical protein